MSFICKNENELFNLQSRIASNQCPTPHIMYFPKREEYPVIAIPTYSNFRLDGSLSNLEIKYRIEINVVNLREYKIAEFSSDMKDLLK